LTDPLWKYLFDCAGITGRVTHPEAQGQALHFTFLNKEAQGQALHFTFLNKFINKFNDL
jgi:hypothetical protein